MTHYLELGASLYVPAMRPDLVAIGNRQKYPALRSVIFCTEDSVRAEDVPGALGNLAEALCCFEPVGLSRFIRVRNREVLRALLTMQGVESITGFVLPKATRHNVADYFSLLEDHPAFRVMLTLETSETFDPGEMAALRDLLLGERYRERVLSLRIGGNDLLALLGLRRPRGRAVYATPLGGVVGQLVTTFRPHGFNLTGPVFEYLDRDDVLRQEVQMDLAHGLFGKSAIHPRQVPVIEQAYRVREADLRDAERVLSESAAPVFRSNEAMCEPATHRAWAQLIVRRAKLYGLVGRRARSWARV
jgi:citrate lyase beta subunit